MIFLRAFFAVAALLLIFTVNSGASRVVRVFRCQGQEVDFRDTTYAVLKKCGEPAYKETISSEGCEKVEKWHYDCIGRGNVEELIFKAGVLADRIEGDDSRGTQTCKPGAD